MTQQYQHIEPAGERIKRWLISERRRRKAAARRGDQIYMASGFPVMVTAEELLAELKRGPDHPNGGDQSKMIRPNAICS